MDSTKCPYGLVYGAFDFLLFCYITGYTDYALLKLSEQRLHPANVTVSDDDRGSHRV